MAKKAKIKATTHIAILDTSILWTDDPAYLVDPEFEDFWNTFSKNNKINLYIPEMVKGELLFQLSRPALNSINKITSSMANISGITGKQYRHNITIEEINVLIEKRFDKWLSAKNGKVVSTPIGRIDWKEVVRMSIWRLPPFEEKKARKYIEEKGFRDAIILETVVDLCRQERKPYDISFICRDAVLRDATNERLRDNPRFSSYGSINDFQSYLKLVNEQLKDEFIKLILNKASEKFFKVGDSDSYFYSKGIKNQILQEYKTYFEDPLLSLRAGILDSFVTGSTPDPGVISVPIPGTTVMPGGIPDQGGYTYISEAVGISNPVEKWEPISGGRFFIGNPGFDKQKESYYYWKSKIAYHREYMNKSGPALLTAYTSNNVLFLSFVVGWKTKVARDGKFLDFKLIGIDMIENYFKPLTDALKEKYGLKIKV